MKSENGVFEASHRQRLDHITQKARFTLKIEDRLFLKILHLTQIGHLLAMDFVLLEELILFWL